MVLKWRHEYIKQQDSREILGKPLVKTSQVADGI